MGSFNFPCHGNSLIPIKTYSSITVTFYSTKNTAANIMIKHTLTHTIIIIRENVTQIITFVMFRANRKNANRSQFVLISHYMTRYE